VNVARSLIASQTTGRIPNINVPLAKASSAKIVLTGNGVHGILTFSVAIAWEDAILAINRFAGLVITAICILMSVKEQEEEPEGNPLSTPRTEINSAETPRIAPRDLRAVIHLPWIGACFVILSCTIIVNKKCQLVRIIIHADSLLVHFVLVFVKQP
jgi:hypothetical protein